MRKSEEPGKTTINQGFALMQELKRFGAKKSEVTQILGNSNLANQLVKFLKTGRAPEVHETVKKARKKQGKNFFGPQDWNKYFGIQLKSSEYRAEFPFRPRNCIKTVDRVPFMLFYCPHSKSLDYSSFWDREDWVDPSGLRIEGLSRELRLLSGKKSKVKEELEKPYGRWLSSTAKDSWRFVGLDDNYDHRGRELYELDQKIKEKYNHYYETREVKIASTWEVLLATIIHCRLHNSPPSFFVNSTITCRDTVDVSNENSLGKSSKRAQIKISKESTKDKPDKIKLRILFNSMNNNYRKTVVPFLKIKKETR